MNSIPGIPPPRPHSKLAGPDKVTIAGSGASTLRNDPVNQPTPPLASLSEVANMSQSERAEYFRTVGEQATAHAKARVVDILT